MNGRSLTDIFEGHAGKLDSESKRNYVRRSRRLLKHLAEREIPEQVLLQVKFPEYLPNFGRQLNYDSCGLNAVRNMLMVSHGRLFEESDLIETVESEFDLKIDGSGVPNRCMPRLVCCVNEQGKKDHIKVFTSAGGTLEHLSFLTQHGYTPIINSYRPEMGETTTHYEVFFGFTNGPRNNGSCGILYNSYWAPKNMSGFHKVKKESFMDYWYCGGQCNDPVGQWFLTAVNGLSLPRDMFRGELLISPKRTEDH